jgi:ribonuclease T2
VQKWCGVDQPYQIHGLWPQITNSTYPSYCETIPYNPIIPSDILLRMNNEWNNCDNDTNLWSHEWEKHGTCFYEQTNLDQMTFFNITLNLFDFIKNTTEEICGNQTECIVGCFDLMYNKINC